ncbi:TetR family transcriptional regulator [Knoellia sp. S7-12]|uniref:TetR/AcrR family transcriptional regulator n=1 Tax=Knoellia sp. S7-12 TaxID=3126698 RepID=UPI003369158D
MARMSADARRVQLIEAAIVVMARDGVAKATTRAIVGEAEMPLGVFHYCFRSKEELLEQVIETIHRGSIERVQGLAGTQTTVEAALRSSLQAYWDHVVANPAMHMLTYELTQYALRQPGLEGVARKQYETYVGTLVTHLDATADRLDVTYQRPTSVLARYLFTIIDGLTLNWLILGDDPDAEAVLDEVASHVAGLAQPHTAPA